MTANTNGDTNYDPLPDLSLRVTAETKQGQRLTMEDDFCMGYQTPVEDPHNPKNSIYVYIGVFDGHGGSEASTYARSHLLRHIISQDGFWSREDEPVLGAIRDGFLEAQQNMQKERVNWERTRDGLLSNAGTTATVAFIRRGKLFIGHVGDSAIILGYEDRDDPEGGGWKAKQLTRDHKPDDPEELARIEESGGKVALDAGGHPRVVWSRPSHEPAEFPFLAMSRALGNFWSHNADKNMFVVSPEPDTFLIDIDVKTFRCLVIASDGVVGVLRPQQVVDSVHHAQMNNMDELPAGSPGWSQDYINPSRNLVSMALNECFVLGKRADNATAVTIMIDPAGSPTAQEQTDLQSSIQPVTPVSTSRRNKRATTTCLSGPVEPSPTLEGPYATRTLRTRRHAVERLEYFQGLAGNHRNGESAAEVKKSAAQAKIGTRKIAPSSPSTRVSRKSALSRRKKRGGRKPFAPHKKTKFNWEKYRNVD